VAGAHGSNEQHRISVGLLVGFGVANACNLGCDPMANYNPYGFGVGLRGGYTFPVDIYLGTTFIYHLGYTDGYRLGRMHLLGVEIGRGFNLGPITLRPFLGLGLGLYSLHTPASGSFNTEGSGTKLALWPGVLGLYNITKQMYIGADVRYTIVPGDASRVHYPGTEPVSANAIAFYANVGYRL
jgi:hypothetical protein